MSTETQFLTGLNLPWLVSNPVGKTNANILGYVLDLANNQILQAIQARMPTLAPSDGLRYIGDERGVFTSLDGYESSTDFAIRVEKSWELWKLAGTAWSLLYNLYKLYNNPNDAPWYLVQVNGNVYNLTSLPPDIDNPQVTITTAGTNPNITGSPAWWTFDNTAAQIYDLGINAPPQAIQAQYTSRFALIIPTPPSVWTYIQSTPNAAGPNTGTFSASSAPSQSDMNALYGIINKWKPAKTTFMGVFVGGDMLGFPASETLGSAGGEVLGGSIVLYKP